jgi:UDP-glucose 4-epimerase
MADNRHIVVTGGAGFIGSHLVERLLAEGGKVVVIDDCSTGKEENLAKVLAHPGLKFLRNKVSECPELERILAQAGGVYHLAAAVGVELVLKSPIETLQRNLHETEAILEHAARFHVPVLLASTSEVYGKSQKEAFSEGDDLLIGPPHFSRWSYACSKLMDEFMALAYAKERGLPVVIARIFNTVGPRQTGRYGMVLPRFIAAAKSGEPLRVFGDGQQTRCFCFVDDTVEALMRLMRSEKNRGEIFNVGTDQEITIKGLAELVVQVLGSVSKIEFVPYQQAYGFDFEDMRRRRPILSKIKAAAEWRAETPLKEIVLRTTREVV